MFQYIKIAWKDYLIKLYRLHKLTKARTIEFLDKRISQPKLTSCPDSLHDCVREDNFFEEERIAWAYDHYIQFVYADFPKQRRDEVVWGEKVIEDNKRITTDWK